MSLDRFKIAQQDEAAGFDVALSELKAGRKTTHWIWYVFPQLTSLGRSSTARFYGLSGLGEACDYLRDSLLRERLLQAIETVDEQLARGISVRDLMGSETDSFKLVSCLTLFEIAAKEMSASGEGGLLRDLAKVNTWCARVLNVTTSQGFPRCDHTLRAVERPGER